MENSDHKGVGRCRPASGLGVAHRSPGCLAAEGWSVADRDVRPQGLGLPFLQEASPQGQLKAGGRGVRGHLGKDHMTLCLFTHLRGPRWGSLVQTSRRVAVGGLGVACEKSVAKGTSGGTGSLGANVPDRGWGVTDAVTARCPGALGRRAVLGSPERGPRPRRPTGALLGFGYEGQ